MLEEWFLLAPVLLIWGVGLLCFGVPLLLCFLEDKLSSASGEAEASVGSRAAWLTQALWRPFHGVQLPPA